MIYDTIPKDLSLMAIGSNCLFYKVNKEKSPLDNIYIKNISSLEHLIQKDYIKLFLNEKNFIRDYNSSWEVPYYIESKILGYVICYHDYNTNKFKIEHIKRVLNFYKFLENVYKKDDYYFLLSLSRSKKELESSSLVEEYFNFLQKYNLLQKTFVFCEEKYSKYFDKVILINRINYSEEENIEKWRKDFLRNIDDVTSLFKQQNY